MCARTCRRPKHVWHPALASAHYGLQVPFTHAHSSSKACSHGARNHCCWPMVCLLVLSVPARGVHPRPAATVQTDCHIHTSQQAAGPLQRVPPAEAHMLAPVAWQGLPEVSKLLHVHRASTELTSMWVSTAAHAAAVLCQADYSFYVFISGTPVGQGLTRARVGPIGGTLAE